MSKCAKLFVALLVLSGDVLLGQTSYPITMTNSGSLDNLQRAQVANGSIGGVANARTLIDETFKLAGMTEPKKFGCIIHVVNWNYVNSGLPITTGIEGQILRDISTILSDLEDSSKLVAVANQLGSGGQRCTLWIMHFNPQFTACALRVHADSRA